MTAPAATRWPAVFAALFAGVVGGFAFGKMSPALPLLKDAFGLSLIQSGWLVAAFNALAGKVGLNALLLPAAGGAAK